MLLLNLLRKIDTFGHPVGYKYKGRHDMYTTATGGFMTLLALCWITIIVVYRILQLNGIDNVFFWSEETTTKDSAIGSVMAADVMVDPNLARNSKSLKEMKLLPYILVYDPITGLPADISKFNADKSPSLDFKRFGSLYFLHHDNDKNSQTQMPVKECT